MAVNGLRRRQTRPPRHRRRCRNSKPFISVILSSVQSVFRSVLHFRRHSLLDDDDGRAFKKKFPAFAVRIVRRRRDSRGVIFTKRSETDDGNKMANGPFLAERQGIQVSHAFALTSLLKRWFNAAWLPWSNPNPEPSFAISRIENPSFRRSDAYICRSRPFFPKTDKVSRTHSIDTANSIADKTI